MSHRTILELDIQGALSSGTFTVARYLLPKIQALNIVRCILEKKLTLQYNSVSSKNLDLFLWVKQSLLNVTPIKNLFVF